jgi:hypothetical protein
MDREVKVVLIVGIIFMFGLGVLVNFLPSPFDDESPLRVGEIFMITGEESKYSCIITEIDNDLVLNCLRAE